MIKFFIKASIFALTILLFSSCAYLFEEKIDNSKQITPTILLSIDGFANDYLERFKPENIIKLAETGVKAKSVALEINLTDSKRSVRYENKYVDDFK